MSDRENLIRDARLWASHIPLLSSAAAEKVWIERLATALELSELEMAENLHATNLLSARLKAVEALIAPQWRSLNYDRNALIDDIRAALNEGH